MIQYCRAVQPLKTIARLPFEARNDVVQIATVLLKSNQQKQLVVNVNLIVYSCTICVYGEIISADMGNKTSFPRSSHR